MAAARTKHTATLLTTGQVLLVRQGSAEVYDPVKKTFQATRGTPTDRKSHSAVLLPDGTVLITGGYVNSISSRTAEIYKPVTRSFTFLSAEMNVARSNHTGTLLLDGTVLLAGGFSGTSPHDETEIHDPAQQVFILGSKMLHHRSNQRRCSCPMAGFS